MSYLGGRKGACKPHWVGYGVLLLGIGSFVFATPHLTSGLYQVFPAKKLPKDTNLDLPLVAYAGFREGTSHQYLLTIRSVHEHQLLDIRSINSRSNGWMGVAKVQVRVSSSATHHGCRWSSVIHARNSFHRRECQLILKNYKKSK